MQGKKKATPLKLDTSLVIFGYKQQDLISWASELNSIGDLKGKLEFIYSKTGFDYLLHQFPVPGSKGVWGIDLTEESYKEIAEYYYSKKKEVEAKVILDEFNSRLNKRNNQTEKKELIQASIEEIQAKKSPVHPVSLKSLSPDKEKQAIQNRSDWLYGYNAEKVEKTPPNIYIQNRLLLPLVIKNTSQGAAEYILERELTNMLNGSRGKNNTTENNYSLKEVAIAYFLIGVTIDKNNAEGILSKHTQFSGTNSINKLLQRRISKSAELTQLTENKGADTKHKNSLLEAKRLISGIKNNNASKAIDQAITTFEAAFNNKYNN